jgi:hypothetical protein
MNQVRYELGLANEIFDKHLLAREIRTNDFDGHAFDEIARPVLFRLIDHAHAAFKNFADDLIPKIALDGKESHVWIFGNYASKSSPLTPRAGCHRRQAPLAPPSLAL